MGGIDEGLSEREPHGESSTGVGLREARNGAKTGILRRIGVAVDDLLQNGELEWMRQQLVRVAVDGHLDQG